jgi:hypothetical protein
MQVVLLPGFEVHLPKPFFDVPLGNQDFGIFCGYGKGMDDSARAWPSWSRAPLGGNFTILLLTESRMLLF